MNILIIGGTSFVAKSFIRYQKSGFDISTVSRIPSGFEKEKVIPEFTKIPDELFKGIDVVMNCAGIVHKGKKVHSEWYRKINFELAVNLATIARKNNVGTFIQLSSVAVYGNKECINADTREEPVNDYGISKFLADQKIMELAGDFFKVIIFRPPMIYGGENSPGNMIRLINLVKTGIPLPFKNAIEKRDFINIRNFVEYIEASIRVNKTNVYLVTDNSPISTFQLVKLISDLLGKKILIFSLPGILIKFLRWAKPEIFEKLYGKLSIASERTSEVLGYKANHSLEEGIREMAKIRFL